MNSTANLIRGVFLSGGGMLIALAGGVVALKLITNTPGLDESAVGVYAIITILGEFLLITCNLGMRSALPKLLGGAPLDERKRLAGASMWYQGAACLLLMAVWLPVWPLLGQADILSANSAWKEAFPYLWVVPVLVLASAFREVLLAILAGMHQYARRAGGLAVYALAQVAFIALFVWLPRANLTVLLLATIASHGVAALYLFYLTPEHARPRRDWPAFRRIVHFGWPLHINAIFGFVFQRLDTLFVGALLGPAAAGLFELGGKKIPQYVTGVLTAALVPYLPSLADRLARDDRPGAARLLDQAYSAFAFFGYFAVFAAMLVREPLIRLLLSPDYVKGAAVLGLIMTASSLALQSGIMGHTLVALGRPQWIAVINIGVAFVSVVLNAVLIPWCGLIGAGYAAVIAASLSQGAQAWLVHCSGLRFGSLAYWRPHVVFAVCAAPMMFICDSPAMAGVCGVIFVVLSVLVGLVRSEQVYRMVNAFRTNT